MGIKAIVVGCMDYRFQKALHDVIKQNGLTYGEYDMVTIKGGAGNFEQLEAHLPVAKALHDPTKVILTIHEDCGAKATESDFERAIEITKRVFGDDIPIVTHYLRLL